MNDFRALEEHAIKRRETLISELIRLYLENSLTLEKAYGIAAVLNEMKNLMRLRQEVLAEAESKKS